MYLNHIENVSEWLSKFLRSQTLTVNSGGHKENKVNAILNLPFIIASLSGGGGIRQGENSDRVEQCGNTQLDFTRDKEVQG